MIDLAAATRDGTLWISGVLMMRPAFAVLDVWPLIQGPDQRGEDTVVPGRPGVLSNPRRATSTTVQLRMVIDGEREVDGSVAEDPRAQVWETVKYLRAFVADPTYLTDGTRTARLVLRNGDELEGPVTVGPLRLGEQGGPIARAALTVTMPQGLLVPA